MAINFKEEQVRVEYVIGEDTVRESQTRELEVPGEKPNIERVLEVNTEVVNVDYTVEDGGVDILTTIEVGVMYVAAPTPDLDPEEYDDQPVHYFHDQIEIPNFVDIPEAEEDMSAYVDVDIIRASYSFDPDENRIVDVTVVLKKFVKVLDYRQITIISDVTGIRKELVEKELLRIENVIAEDTYSVVVEGILDVPANKPEIERILKVTGGLVENETATVTDGGVIVDGEFQAGIMYVALEDNQPVHFAEGTFDISEVVDLPGAEEGMTTYTNINVKRWDYTVRENDAGEAKVVEVRAVVEIFVKVLEPRQIMVVTGIDSDRVEVEEALLRVEEVIGENTVGETVTKELIVPTNKPNIEEGGILEASAQLEDVACEVEDGGVLITGNIKGGILYVAAPTPDLDPEEYDDQPVHYFHDERSFDNFVNIPEAEAGMSCYKDVIIKKVRATRTSSRTVDLVVTLSKFAKVTNFRQLTIVTDIVVVSPVVDQDECERPSRVIYVVQPGDTLYKIARRYRTTVDAIVEANDISNPDVLEIGQKLIIPRCIIDGPRG
ncbi:DUF3794 and LysM peptidoglycan-binding domain-containing protein [Orenia marismortui]|uniref:DUF3794 and LysM peptidoglycan-binding domain-containing protein n=1 Tax=Orenia marismortui TaxID=46469 RepID=UPI0003744F32|nr:SPOCS domain-containing protein [Orenia marismortui]